MSCFALYRYCFNNNKEGNCSRHKSHNKRKEKVKKESGRCKKIAKQKQRMKRSQMKKHSKMCPLRTEDRKGHKSLHLVRKYTMRSGDL